MNFTSLNEGQRRAAETLEGPLMVLAGAGAGKTKTITERIVEIIKRGAEPSSILAITFTNKAAREMKERVHARIAADPSLNLPISLQERPFVSTFHSLGVHILKENARLLNIPRHFKIYDKQDSKRAIKEAIVTNGLDPKQFDPGKISSIISRAKGDYVDLGAFSADAEGEYFPEIVARIWRSYEIILREEKALDFDDLLVRTARLLEENMEVRARYQSIWNYVHVDEYQDTNGVQYTIAKLLTGEKQNICVVGDIDQTIYTWRGANLKNLLNFEKDYPGAAIILLEQNYRSTQTILNAANQIIAKNKFRKDKRLFTENAEGEKISLYDGLDEAEEASFVAEEAKKQIEKGTLPEEIAVLYRANFQSRALEEAFLSRGMKYQVLGTRFFERKEVKDVLTFIRAALNPESRGDIKRVINTPPRGIGKVTLLKIFEGKRDSLTPAMRGRVDDFFNLLSAIAKKAVTDKPSDVVKFVIEKSGLEAALKGGSDEDLERLENIRELGTLAVRYDSLPPEEGIETLLADAALAGEQDSLTEKREGVRLMTIHASKGLEFDCVFITGLEDGLFPHAKIHEGEISGEEAEEERRLFYVALTRARKKIFLTYAHSRMIFGSRQYTSPSEFIFDIDEALVEQQDPSARPRKPLLNIEF